VAGELESGSQENSGRRSDEETLRFRHHVHGGSALSLNSFFSSISPETDCVAFFVNALETTSGRIDDQIQVFRFAFIWVKPEGLVFHVHFGGR